MRPVEQWRKAIVAAVAGGLAAAVPVVADGAMSLPDWCIVAGAAVVAGGAVYATPNKSVAPAEAEATPDQMS